MAAVTVIEPNPSGDEAFARFVRARWRPMMQLAYGLTLDHGHAEDLVQDAFAKLWPRWSRVRDDAVAQHARSSSLADLMRFRRDWCERVPQQPRAWHGGGFDG